jgi:hypothetical protein
MDVTQQGKNFSSR